MNVAGVERISAVPYDETTVRPVNILIPFRPKCDVANQGKRGQQTLLSTIYAQVIGIMTLRVRVF